MNPVPRPFWLKLALFVFFFIASAAAIVAVQILRGATELTVDYMPDNGYVLSVTQMLMRGKLLYQGVAWLYGSIPIGLYYLFASVVGNSPNTFLSFEFIWSIPVAFLIYILVRRRLSFLYTLLFLALLFQVENPLSKQIIYEKFELIFLLLAALTWKPLEKRTTLHCLAFGLLIALLQFTKFGPHIAFAIALVLLDVLQVVQKGFSRDYLRLAFTKNILTFGFYLFVLAIAVCGMALFLNPTVIKDVLWPSFMQSSYSYVTSDERFPRYFNLGYFIQAQACPLAGLAACLWAIFRLLRSSPASGKERGNRFLFPLRTHALPPRLSRRDPAHLPPQLPLLSVRHHGCAGPAAFPRIAGAKISSASHSLLRFLPAADSRFLDQGIQEPASFPSRLPPAFVQRSRAGGHN